MDGHILSMVISFFVLVAPLFTSQWSTTAAGTSIARGDATYVAAVVAFKAQKYVGTAALGFYLNVDHYAQMASYLMANSTKKPDIIVFPEGGLTGENELFPVAVPSAEDFIVPCGNNQYDMGVRQLSCLAESLSTYLVVNLPEAHFNATRNATLTFNTVVVFNRNGAVVARYRKSNQNEPVFDSPGVQEMCRFTSDFRVTFGVTAGNDLTFKEPGDTLTGRLGVGHILHPTKWRSTLPYFTGIQVQSGWSFSTDVVLLSAGYTDPPSGFSGTGIYAGAAGPLDYSQPESDEPYAHISEIVASDNLARRKDGVKKGKVGKGVKVVLEDVIRQPNIHAEMTMERMEERIWSRHSGGKPKGPGKAAGEGDSRLLPLIEPMEGYTTRLLVPSINESKLNGTEPTITGLASLDDTICRKGFCCSFQGKLMVTYAFNYTGGWRPRGDDYSGYLYRLALFDGRRGSGGLGEVSCGVLPCLNASLSSCALRAGGPPSARMVTGRLYVQTEATFLSLAISGNFSRRGFATPEVLLKGKAAGEFGSLPEPTAYRFTTLPTADNRTVNVTFGTTGVIEDLVSAGIRVRMYDRDGSSSAASLAAISLSTSVLLFLIAVATFTCDSS